MDETTLRYYEEHAGDLAARHLGADRHHVHETLRRWLHDGNRVLEIGCGCRSDVEFMASLGVDITATDASQAMLEQVPSSFRGMATFRCVAFPLLEGDPLLSQQFDGIVATAVLMHIADSELFRFAYQVRSLLKSGGRLICSFSVGREQSAEDTRLYVRRQPEEMQLLFERLGFRLVDVESTPDGLGRGFSWTTLVFASEGPSAARPLDQIESIMNRDRNTTTYKLALLRALCEISQTSFKHARWHASGEVSVPLGLIVEKWLYYYWPLIEAPIFLPEMRTGARTKGIAFRPALQNLAASCKPGGLDTFHSSFRSGQLSDNQLSLLSSAVQSMANAIIKGPVVYSGGSLDRAQPVFRYVGRRTKRVFLTPMDLVMGLGEVYLPSSLWREMCLVGHWIGEAVILRWARLSQNFANQNVTVSEVLAQLLVGPQSERDVQQARAIYSGRSDLVCVWTGERVSRMSFDVEHVIPFSFWPNNYLWNLLPTSPKVNNQKRDRIVTQETLTASRDRVIHFWRIGRETLPRRFNIEVEEALLGSRLPNTNWEAPAFTALAETVEVIATHRGALRWDAAVHV